MRVVGRHRGARTICLALVAGFVAFEAALAFGAGAVGIPGIYLFHLTAEGGEVHVTELAEQAAGGESVVAKLAASVAPPAKPQDTLTPSGEPRLDGLIDVPLQEWVREKPKLPEGKAFGAEAKGHSDLPWDAIEPVPFDAPSHATADATASIPNRVQPDVPLTPLPPVVLAELPSNGAVASWVKAKAMELKGEDRGRPLFHFEFWLDAPDQVKQRVVAVAYEFNTPAVMPQSQISTEKQTGFRVAAGGLTCADNVKVTLKFDDGRTQQVEVDGCKLLG